MSKASDTTDHLQIEIETAKGKVTCDIGVVALVRALNEWPEITTISSCEYMADDNGIGRAWVAFDSPKLKRTIHDLRERAAPRVKVGLIRLRGGDVGPEDVAKGLLPGAAHGYIDCDPEDVGEVAAAIRLATGSRK